MALRRAEHHNTEDVEYYREVLKQYDDWFQVSGFAHPKVLMYTNNKPFTPEPHTWGLVPNWAKSPESIWNNTLNAKSELMFEKSSFRKSAESKRCIIPAAGFYEHHHFNGKAYPFYIKLKDEKPMYFAGLWNDWANQETGEILKTFAIVTTRANNLMAKIHNKPKFSDEPRMPVILPENVTEEYLKPLSRKEIEELCAPFPDSQLEAITVKSLSGKNSPGNVQEANEKYHYPELVFDTEDEIKWTLF